MSLRRETVVVETLEEEVSRRKPPVVECHCKYPEDYQGSTGILSIQNRTQRWQEKEVKIQSPSCHQFRVQTSVPPSAGRNRVPLLLLCLPCSIFYFVCVQFTSSEEIELMRSFLLKKMLSQSTPKDPIHT